MSYSNKKCGTLSTVLTNSRAAFDLASIMVGVVVIGIIAGVVAATVFAVVPWTQDNSAKQSLNAVTVAENTYYGFTSQELPSAYGTSEQLTERTLLTQNSDIAVGTDTVGSCYVAVAESATGTIFYITDSEPKPEVYNATVTVSCLDIKILVTKITT